MEDVLASIRRAIDENAHGSAQDRLSGSMAEFRVKFDAPANQETSKEAGTDVLFREFLANLVPQPFALGLKFRTAFESLWAVADEC